MQDLLTPTKIVRTKRKTLSLIINNNGDLIVRAPLKCTDSVIFDFISKKANWIISKRQNSINPKFAPLKLVDNEELNILGDNYTIKLADIKSVKIINNIILVPKINSKHYLILFLKRQLKKLVSEKIDMLNAIYDFEVKNISVSSAKTNWGSCSAENKLHFTYKLMLCPEQIIDYIVVHELVHTIIKNHSKNFWRNVKKIYPHYKQCELWLKENRGIVNIL